VFVSFVSLLVDLLFLAVCKDEVERKEWQEPSISEYFAGARQAAEWKLLGKTRRFKTRDFLECPYLPSISCETPIAVSLPR